MATFWKKELRALEIQELFPYREIPESVGEDADSIKASLEKALNDYFSNDFMKKHNVIPLNLDSSLSGSSYHLKIGQMWVDNKNYTGQSSQPAISVTAELKGKQVTNITIECHDEKLAKQMPRARRRLGNKTRRGLGAMFGAALGVGLGVVATLFIGALTGGVGIAVIVGAGLAAGLIGGAVTGDPALDKKPKLKQEKGYRALEEVSDSEEEHEGAVEQEPNEGAAHYRTVGVEEEYSDEHARDFEEDPRWDDVEEVSFVDTSAPSSTESDDSKVSEGKQKGKTPSSDPNPFG